MNKLLTAAAALTFLATAGHSAVAQDASGEPLATCSIVIDLQYEGDTSRDGDCIAATSNWLASIGAPSAETDAQVVEAVLALTELFRAEQCEVNDTELSEAIETAAAAIVDDETRAEIQLIAEQIAACDFVATAAIDDDGVDLPVDLLGDPQPASNS